jgi:lysyl-tRNA synthetase class 2
VSGAPAPWRVAPAVATAAAGVLTLASSLLPTVPWRERVLESIEPGSAQHLAHAAGLLGGLALLVLAISILRGRRRPIHAAIVLLGVVAVVHLAKGLDYEEAAIALGIAAVLRLGVRAAARDAEPPRAASAALLVLLALAGGYILAFAVELASGRGHVGPELARAAAMLSGGPAAGLGDEAAAILHVLAALALVGTIAFVRALLAPGRARDGHGAGEHERAAAIVVAHAGDSIAPFTLRADKAFFFAHGGVLAYRTLRETAVVSGDPVGPPGSAPAILDAFLGFARRRGWDVVVLAARDEHLGAYRELGLRSLRIGSEAVVDPRGFDLHGRERKTVRKAVNRVERHGWTIELVAGGELTRRHVAEIGAVERAWRARHTRLYGYAMAMDRLWGAQEDEGDLYVLARAPWGEVRAFQRYVPYRGGLSLDAMRRLDDEPNGISDALVAAALAHARDAGCREVSLNFSSFAHVMAAETLERRSHRLARWALRRMRHRFQLERLARFASKFGPEWRPRYLVYTSQVRLPLAALRVMQAEAYVRPPRVRLDPTGWHPAPRPARLATAPNGRA